MDSMSGFSLPYVILANFRQLKLFSMLIYKLQRVARVSLTFKSEKVYHNIVFLQQLPHFRPFIDGFCTTSLKAVQTKANSTKVVLITSDSISNFPPKWPNLSNFVQKLFFSKGTSYRNSLIMFFEHIIKFSALCVCFVRKKILSWPAHQATCPRTESPIDGVFLKACAVEQVKAAAESQTLLVAQSAAY